MDTYTIQEISQKFDLPASTLRYYEDIGLLTDVERTENNQRVYNFGHVCQLNAISCFKRTGMSIAKIQEFFSLSQDMENNIDAILELIYDHEASIHDKLAKMQDDLGHIRHKIRHYQGIKKAIAEKKPWPDWAEFKEAEKLSNHEFFQVVDSIFEVFPMVVYVNLTQNKYLLLKQDNFLAFNLPNVGCFENLLQAFAQGKTDIYAELYQKSHDDNFHWVSTHVIRTKSHGGDICHICLNRILDGVHEKDGGSRK